MGVKKTCMCSKDVTCLAHLGFKVWIQLKAEQPKKEKK